MCQAEPSACFKTHLCRLFLQVAVLFVLSIRVLELCVSACRPEVRVDVAFVIF
ncbi:hypothetical protein DVU_1966 [Nitratidesulfovibrio vulgaris str. Hildenborough]|uniref:Uncharacterized protein n=1 Tax=Nitratidesulfovibrio vulgaris (strain ATCC 29579 / DSM 644 / CCUG 34227 / NCIMB 8303 / VKM B-1760 / Hildenborough) TaxID=882 RepID=Q72AM6_NITV2|nr:hypothetical protein DVU_1966 [Nitratidesulfovibrio vulgaris str. Hildenborough]